MADKPHDDDETESEEENVTSDDEDENQNEDPNDEDNEQKANNQKPAVPLTPQEILLSDQMPKKKSDRISAAIYKTKMMSEFLQDPDQRQVIWNMVERMLIRRGYTWVSDLPAPPRHAYLLPTNKNFLYIYHRHAVKEGCEPIFVLFFSKLGEPNLKTLGFPSRHIVIVSDSLTGKAKTAISENANQNNYPLIVRHPERPLCETYPMTHVYIESFTSNQLTFDIMKTYYLQSMQLRLVTDAAEIQIAREFAGDNDLNRLPHLSSTDPVALYFGFRPGMVIEETHLSGNAGRLKSWRIVVRPKPSNRVAVNFGEPVSQQKPEAKSTGKDDAPTIKDEKKGPNPGPQGPQSSAIK